MSGATASETERSTPETVQAGERVAELLVIPQGMDVVEHMNNKSVSAALARTTNLDVVILQIVTLPRQGEAASSGRLTDRELEILILAARGFSNRQIGGSLHLSVGTVKRHLVNIYTKMKVRSRGETASKALSEGWITLGDFAWREEKRR
jgi:DNA-binding NarL/FixJ family response regulator